MLSLISARAALFGAMTLGESCSDSPGEEMQILHCTEVQPLASAGRSPIPPLLQLPSPAASSAPRFWLKAPSCSEEMMLQPAGAQLSP